MTQNYKEIILKLKNERYPDAKTIFWAGSLSKSPDNVGSDLDLIIIYKKLERAYREAFIYENVPIDAFIHDEATLRYFFKNIDQSSLILGLPAMIAEGIELPNTTEFGNQFKEEARVILASDPPITDEQLNMRRFFITDLLDDLKVSKDKHEKMAIAFRLYKDLAEFYLLSNKKYLASGKHLPRFLQKLNPEIAKEFGNVFDNYQDIDNLISFARKILKPYGGLLWDGFRSNAPKEWR
jgi:hypothetical protein